MYFRKALGVETIGFLREESLIDRILFILITIKSFELKSFALENEDDGRYIFPYDRFSSTLSTISIHTVRAFEKVSKNARLSPNRTYFT